MSFKSLLRSLAVSAILPTYHAYYIDSSCDAYADLIRSATAQALDSAQAAADAITANPRDSNVARLVQLLFGERPANDPENKWLNKPKDAFEGMQALKNSRSALPVNEGEEVVIYCNMDRFKKRDDGRWVDTVTNKVLKNDNDNDEESVIKECSTLSLTLAYTTIPAPDTFALPGEKYTKTDFPSQVTICPWFLQWAKSQTYRTWGELFARVRQDQSLKSLVAMLAIPLISDYVLAPIDALSLFDKVLLHEFTHTMAGGQLKDVKMSEGGFFGAAYGWHAARNLAAQDQPNEYDSARWNADSVALFASGVRLLGLRPPQYINDVGKVTGVQPIKRSIDANGTTPEHEHFAEVLTRRYSFERALSLG